MLPCGAGGLGRSHDFLDAPTTPPPSGKVVSVFLQPRRATLAKWLTDPWSTCEVAHQLTLMVVGGARHNAERGLVACCVVKLRQNQASGRVAANGARSSGWKPAVASRYC